MTEARPAIRLDKWLWQARFAKSRALAARLVADGAVRVNAVRVTEARHRRCTSATASASRKGRTVRAIRIPALGTRRGPAAEARLLYADLDPPRPLEPAGQADK